MPIRESDDADMGSEPELTLENLDKSGTDRSSKDEFDSVFSRSFVDGAEDRDMGDVSGDLINLSRLRDLNLSGYPQLRPFNVHFEQG